MQADTGSKPRSLSQPAGSGSLQGTTRSYWASGMEMTVVGALEAGITYGLGRAFAV